jgi:4-hydroxy-2-oxoglutarate aldolase
VTGRLAGVLGPVITTFDRGSGEIARAPFESNLRAHFAAGLAGVIVGGSTGEGALLDDAERALLVEWARAQVPADRWLIAGTGAESTRACIARTREAARRGADGVLVVAPHYYGSAMTDEALAAHYRRVADASPVPVLLYNIPKYAHFTLSPALVRGLASHGNIAGIKDSSGDLDLLAAYLGVQDEGFTVLTGNGTQLAPAMALGARGGILAVALFTGSLAPEIFAHAARGDRASAQAAQDRMTPLAREIVGGMGPAGIKAAMDRAGLAGGPVRAPLLPLDDTGRRRVDELLRAAGVPRAA